MRNWGENDIDSNDIFIRKRPGLVRCGAADFEFDWMETGLRDSSFGQFSENSPPAMRFFPDAPFVVPNKEQAEGLTESLNEASPSMEVFASAFFNRDME